MTRITVALAGNPNSGKTTIFNRLTGARQHVGNYPGVTVEKKEGHRRHGAVDVHVVDLPGTYSLMALSLDEVVARDFVVQDRPDVVIHVVDASNLERNLYLAVELIELGAPLVLAFNMSDVAASRGVELDLDTLSGFFGAPIVRTVGHKGEGIAELLDAAVAVARGEWRERKAHVAFSREVEAELEPLTRLVAGSGRFAETYGARWVAVKLLEGDGDVREHVADSRVLEAADAAAGRLDRHFGDPPHMVLPDQRYGFVSGACQETVRTTVESRHRFSDRVDVVVTSRFLGIPVFLALMYVVFQLTFAVGGYPMGWIESGFGALGGWLDTLWPKGSESMVRSLLVDGVIGGVGGVVVFLPNIMLLFLAIAVLEDSGYMARAAFIMDHLMHKIGLHGKSFIPMLIGFGCSVPAIMATRTLENRRDRLTTMLVLPLMSCGARLPIYALIIPAFFAPRWQAPMLWLIYLIGIVLAVACAKLLRATLFRGESDPFVMELPPYRLPTLRGALIHMWERSWLYLKKAGTIILGVSIVLWALTTYPRKSTFHPRYAARLDAARAAHAEGLAALAADLGPAGRLVQQALQAERDAADEQAQWHEHQAEFASAEQRKDARVAELRRARGGERLATFLRLREGVVAARERFRATVEHEGLAEDSSEYAAVATYRDNTLARLRAEDPAVYRAAVGHLDQVQAPLEATLRQVEQEKRGQRLAHSVAGRIGHGLEPVMQPLGFDWRITTAFLGAFAAKEVFVAQMGIVFSIGETQAGSEQLRSVLRRNYSPLVGFCIMLFALIATPCMATVAITRRESGAWRWALLQLGGLTALAYLVTLVVFQVATLLGG